MSNMIPQEQKERLAALLEKCRAYRPDLTKTRELLAKLKERLQQQKGPLDR